MSSVARYTTWLIILLLAAAIGVASQFGMVRQASYESQGYTANAGELTGDTLIGQTLVAERDNLSAISVMFATYSGRGGPRPVLFSLREGIDGPDVRAGSVAASALGDNQLYRFEFEPLVDSGGKTYFFHVTSPGSIVGESVTVDVDARDPYHLGSAYIVRGTHEDKLQPDVLSAAGKPTLDVAFATYYSVPLREAVWDNGLATARGFVETWDERRSVYVLWARVAVQAFVFLGIALVAAVLFDQNSAADKNANRTRAVLGAVFVLAVVVRVLYAVELPFTNDEGNYLYDARTLLEGGLAGGDGYVKAPLVILWVALWELVGGLTLLGGRLSSVVIGALTVFPLYFIGRELWGRRAGVAAAAAWALLGVTTVFSIYIHTQPLALFFGISGIAVLLMALRGTTPGVKMHVIPPRTAHIYWFLLAGVLLGLGVVSRKSVLALGLVPLVLIITEGLSLKERLRQLGYVGLGFIVVVGVLLIFAAAVYGVEGFWEAAGFNSAEDGISAVDPAEEEQVRAYSIRGMTPFFRESLPLILLALAGLGIAGERLAARLLSLVHGQSPRMSRVLADYVVPKLAWLLPAGLFLWAWSFFLTYEGSSVMLFGMRQLWWAMAAVLVLIALFTSPRAVEETTEGRNQREDDIRHGISSLLVPLLWMGGLMFFYMNWIKFHANYIGEFLPALVLLAGIAVPVLWQRLSVTGSVAVPAGRKAVRTLLALSFLAVLFWALFASGYITFVHEHTGTFQQDAVREAADWAAENIPAKEPIFTGAAIVPYLSGHRTALDIAHPRWYAYEFTRTDTARLNTFLPPIEEMLQAYREANWLLLEKQTGFSFLMEYSEIEAGLETDWERVHGIENGSNTLTFYKRVSARE